MRFYGGNSTSKVIASSHLVQLCCMLHSANVHLLATRTSIKTSTDKGCAGERRHADNSDTEHTYDGGYARVAARV